MSQTDVEEPPETTEPALGVGGGHTDHYQRAETGDMDVEEGEVLEEEDFPEQEQTKETNKTTLANVKRCSMDDMEDLRHQEFIEKKKQQLAELVRSQLATAGLHTNDNDSESDHISRQAPAPDNKRVLQKPPDAQPAIRGSRMLPEFSPMLTSKMKDSSAPKYSDLDRTADPEEAMISNWAKGSRNVTKGDKYKRDRPIGSGSPEPLDIKRMRGDDDVIDSFDDYYGRTSPHMQADITLGSASRRPKETVSDKDYRTQTDTDLRKCNQKPSSKSGYGGGPDVDLDSEAQSPNNNNNHGDIDERLRACPPRPQNFVANRKTADVRDTEGAIEDGERRRRHSRSSDSSIGTSGSVAEGASSEPFNRHRSSKPSSSKTSRGRGDYNRSSYSPSPTRVRRPGPDRRERPYENRGRDNNRICRFFRDGYCREGKNCSYSHDISPMRILADKIPEVCKFYVNGFCRNGNHCPFFHEEYPCKFYHMGQCQKGLDCKFSHDQLNEVTSGIFEKLRADEELEYAQKNANIGPGPANDRNDRNLSSRRKCLLGAPPPAGPPQNAPPRMMYPPPGQHNMGGPPGPGPGPMNCMGPMPMNMNGGPNPNVYDSPNRCMPDMPIDAPQPGACMTNAPMNQQPPCNGQMLQQQMPNMPPQNMMPQNMAMNQNAYNPNMNHIMNQGPMAMGDSGYGQNNMQMLNPGAGSNVPMGPPGQFNQMQNYGGGPPNMGPPMQQQMGGGQMMGYYPQNAQGNQMQMPQNYNSMGNNMQNMNVNMSGNFPPPQQQQQMHDPNLQQQPGTFLHPQTQGMQNNMGQGSWNAPPQMEHVDMTRHNEQREIKKDPLDDFKYSSDEDNNERKLAIQQEVKRSPVAEEVKPMSFSITDMLKQIRQNVGGGADILPKPEAPSSPVFDDKTTPYSPSSEAEDANVSSISTPSIPLNASRRRLGGRPVWQLFPCDVDQNEHYISDAVLQQSLTDARIRSDPRLRKCVSNQFDAVSQIISSKTSRGVDLESPASPPPESSSSQMSLSRDPRSGRDPRLTKGPVVGINPPQAAIQTSITAQACPPPALPNPGPVMSAMPPNAMNYGCNSGNVPLSMINAQPYFMNPPGMQMNTPANISPVCPPMMCPPGMAQPGSGPGWMPQLNQNANGLGFSSLPDIPLASPANMPLPKEYMSGPSTRLGPGFKRERDFKANKDRNVDSGRNAEMRYPDSGSEESPDTKSESEQPVEVLSLREKRKDLLYESPLAAKVTKLSAGVKVKKRGAGNIENNC